MSKTGTHLNEKKTSSSSGYLVAAVIPCYREKKHIETVLASIGKEVTNIYVIDDACPEGTGDIVEKNCKDPRIKVLRHKSNKGVGGATLTGYVHALNDGFDIAVKLDGDGQMDGTMIPRLISPIISGIADYTKGNRFHAIYGISEMPWSRIFGNFLLSLVSKFSSGYWNILDPTNGFTAIHSDALKKLDQTTIAKRFFFESDMLFHLSMIRAVVMDIPMKAKYGAEESGIHALKVVPEFLFKHSVNAFKRLLFNYFIREINQATVYLLLGSLLLLFGIVFGAINWATATMSGIPATAGTVILAALPIILGSQALIAFLNFDTRNLPKNPIQKLDKTYTEENLGE